MKTKEKHENLFFALRVLAAFVVLAGVLVGVYFVAYRAYPTVAEWTTAGSHDAFVMDGVTYRRYGVLGKGGIREKDYTIDESVGRVADDGAGYAEGETQLPDGDPDLSRDHAYVLYSVKNQENTLLLLETDGSYALYYREVATWKEPGDRQALLYGSRTYELVGILGKNGLNQSAYAENKKLGYVGNALQDTDDEMLCTVKIHLQLLIVKGADGYSYLYSYDKNPDRPETVPETLPETSAES